MALRESNKPASSANVLAAGRAGKKKTVEETFTKLTQLEHILLRPETYIGAADCVLQQAWVWDDLSARMVHRDVTYPPGLYKIFDEILVNAADHKQRDQSMNTLRVDLDTENQRISVYNNGAGIPVEIHHTEGMYVPELIFGNLLTSSNYNDDEKKVVGGRNGFGAKLANIFSREFVVETADMENGKRYKQVFRDNMQSKEEPQICNLTKKEAWTKISFVPDLERFNMTSLDSDIIALMKKRVYDIAGVNPGLKVFLNGTRLPIKTFVDYVGLYTPENSACPVLHERINDRWQVAITASEGQLSQVSFVNSIWTIKGGTHVAHVADQVVAKIQEHITKKNKGMKVKPFQVKSQLSLFINCLVENPAFDSQTKETLTTKPSKFGSRWDFSEELAKKVMKSSIVENVLAFARFKESKELTKTDGGKKGRVLGIPKLDDANKAGSRESAKCSLILTEGESAKSMAVSGLSVVGRDYYGVYPLRGKLLNVRDAKHKQIMDNAEITNLKKIVGLQHGKTYTADTIKTLRYGHILIMVDQDNDGSHIKGLLINFFAHFWPSLLEIDGFLQEFVTPIVTCKKGKETRTFFTMPEYKTWAESEQVGKWETSYLKGLGTSEKEEVMSYFANFPGHLHEFVHNGPDDSDMIEMAFSKQRVTDRKDWLSAYAPGTFFNHAVDELNYSNFVNKELVLFSMADNARSIPSAIDGLKPSQRKVLFACFKRKIKGNMKVGSLSGYIVDACAYHHGEVSIQSTIVGMAQNFIGSNNINLLVPSGQFGTRLQGGKDAAAARYINTRLAPVARALFPEDDDALLNYLEDEGLGIEPDWYCPVIPTVLVNGAEGIGTGWSTSVPCYNPRDIIANIRRMLNGEEPLAMIPWYRGFSGSVVPVGNSKTFDVHGSVSVCEEANTYKITELPARSWIAPYKEFLDTNTVGNSNAKDPLVDDYRDNGTESKVNFTISMPADKAKMMSSDFAYKMLKLTSSVSTSNMVLFDAQGRIRKYEEPEQILQEFFDVRLELYAKRRLNLLQELENDLVLLDNKKRFIEMVVDNKLRVAKRKKAEILSDLIRLKFKSIPKVAKKGGKAEDVNVDGDAEMTNGDKDSGEDVSAKGYEYLLSLSLWSLTIERVVQLRSLRDAKASERDAMKLMDPKELWQNDLTHLEEVMTRDEHEGRMFEKKLEKVAMAARARQRGMTSKTSGRGRGKKAVGANAVYQDDDDTTLEPIPPPKARVVAVRKPRQQAATAALAKKKSRTTASRRRVSAEMVACEDVDIIELADDDDDMDSADFCADNSSSDERDDVDHVEAGLAAVDLSSLQTVNKQPARSKTTKAKGVHANRKPAKTRKSAVTSDEDDDSERNQMGLTEGGEIEAVEVVGKPITNKTVRERKAAITVDQGSGSDGSDAMVTAARKKKPSKAKASKGKQAAKLTLVHKSESDSDDSDFNLSLTQRLAQRLAISKSTAAKGGMELEEKVDSNSDNSLSSPLRKPVAKSSKTGAVSKRPRSAKKSKPAADLSAEMSPAPSPQPKKSRVGKRSPLAKRGKAVSRSRKATAAMLNEDLFDFDNEIEVEEVKDVQKPSARPRRTAPTKKIVIESDESGDSDICDSSEFQSDDDDYDSDFE